MSHLYVCHFSNGHIKVGKTTQDPQDRVFQHRDRVACMGVKLDRWMAIQCHDRNLDAAEATLIRFCDQHATARFLNEWFEGLDFKAVQSAAEVFVMTELVQGKPNVEGAGVDFREVYTYLRNRGLTQVALAGICGCDQSCISDIANGRTKDPRYSIGAALVALVAQQPTQA